MIDDPLGAFVRHADVRIAGSTTGPLAGLTFAVKDLIDVAGVPTGAGNPDWLRTHDVPQQSAPIVQKLLDAGATLVGKTITDEIAFSVNGRNHHYGAPINPNAPGRLCGGSSSGSASATAGHLVDFALGTDTGGSVRIPASYCGIYGIRPTHGRVSAEGVVPFAPSFDVVGWFARNAALFQKIGPILLDPASRQEVRPRRVLVADDVFGVADASARAALEPAIAKVANLVGTVEHVTLDADGLKHWFKDAYLPLQHRETWLTHRAWIEAVQPEFGPGIKERFARTRTITDGEVAKGTKIRAAVRARLAELLDAETILLLPAAPGIAPLVAAPEEALTEFRARVMAVTSAGGLSGYPQVSLPMAQVDGCPIGLGVMAMPGGDEALLDLAVRLAS